MGTSVSQSLQLASAIRERRIQLLKMTIKQAAEFSGLKTEQWTDLEAGWIPPMDNTLWIWWTLAGTLSVSVSKLFNLAGADLARQEMLAKRKAAA
jgi:hypothetical protein